MARKDLSGRRAFLKALAAGSGSLVAAGHACAQDKDLSEDPLRVKTPHFAPRAKRVIFMFMTGGVSHVDSFDPKPRLFGDHGKTVKIDNWQGKYGDYNFYFKTPDWKFRRGGKCGTHVSDLFPHTRQIVDDLCVIRSMSSDHTNHYEASLGMHTGSFTFARPSLGAWVSYGLGTENINLPPFMVVAPKAPYAGTQTWGSDFLPAAYQGTRVLPGRDPVANVTPLIQPRDLQALELQELQRLNRLHLAQRNHDSSLAARIRSFTTAFGMEQAAPEAFDLSHESPATLDLYGLQPGQHEGFGWQCLMARRLAERGVRFIELIDVGSSANWDAHGDMATHRPLAKNVDQPIAGLIRDLKQRGMLDDTLVVWTTEFGRTPYHQDPKAKGREHHHQCFSSWLAGGGVKPGMVYGATDDHGIDVVEDRVHVHDFHATILHLMGLDHKKLTYRYAGRDFRLTDVHGHVVRELFA